MQLLRRESIQIDTRASPTAFGIRAHDQTTASAVYDSLSGGYSTVSRGAHATETNHQFVSSTLTTLIPVSVAVEDWSSNYQTTDTSTISGGAVLGIILGSIVAIVLCICALTIYIKRRKREKAENRVLAEVATTQVIGARVEDGDFKRLPDVPTEKREDREVVVSLSDLGIVKHSGEGGRRRWG